MPSFSQLYTYVSNSQGFIATSGSNTVLAWSAASGNPPGCLNMVRAVKGNNNSTSSWSVTGTFNTAFGLPVSATITSIASAQLQWQCNQFTSANASSGGPAVITYAGTGVTLSNTIGFSASGASFTTTTGAGATGLSWPTTGTFTISISGTLANANTTGSTISLNQDQLAFGLVYSQVLAIDTNVHPQEFLGRNSSDKVQPVELLSKRTSPGINAPRHKVLRRILRSADGGFFFYRLVESSYPSFGMPLESLSSRINDQLAQIEYSSVKIRMFDRTFPIEFSSREMHDWIMPIESTSLAAAVGQSGNFIIQNEFLASWFSDQRFPISELMTLPADFRFPDEFLGRNAVDSEPILEYTGSRTQDFIIPLEDLAGQSRDHNNPISFMSNFGADSRIPIEMLGRQNKDGIIPVELLGRGITDTINPIEVLGGKTIDYRNPVSFVGNVGGDIRAPLESLSIQNQDNIIALESLTGQLKDNISPVEYSAVAIRSTDVFAPLEFVANISRDSNVFIEWLNSQVIDSVVRDETLFGNKIDTINYLTFLGALVKDAINPQEFISSVTTDRLLSQEFLSGARPTDQQAPIESLFGNKIDTINYLTLLGSLKKDTIGPQEFISAITTDRLLNQEFLSSARPADQQTLMESLFGNKTDSFVILEFLKSTFIDINSPLEWLGATLRITDSVAPVEWRSLIISITDSRLPLEYLGSPYSDSKTLVEIISNNMRSDSIIQSEFGTSVFRDLVNPVEVLMRIPIDLNNPIEFVQNFIMDQNVLAEFVMSNIRSDVITRSEYLSSLLRDKINPLEMLLGQLSDSRNPLEWLGGVGVTKIDMMVPIEIQRLMFGDTNIPAEFVFRTALLNDTITQLEILELLSLHTIAPIEITRLLNTDVNSLQSWLQSTVMNNIIRLEHSSSMISLRDFITPIEFRSFLSSHSLLLSESVASSITDNIFGQSWNKSIRFDSSFMQEFGSNLFSDAKFINEYISSVASQFGDSILPVEFQLQTRFVQSDSTLLLEAVFSISTDANGLLEFHGVPSIIMLSSLGRLSTPIGKIRISNSPGKIRISVPIKKIRIT